MPLPYAAVMLQGACLPFLIGRPTSE